MVDVSKPSGECSSKRQREPLRVYLAETDKEMKIFENMLSSPDIGLYICIMTVGETFSCYSMSFSLKLRVILNIYIHHE